MGYVGDREPSVETVLHGKDPWKLVAHDTPLGKPPRSKLYSFIEHLCPSHEDLKMYWYSLELIDEACGRCGEFPPVGIMGLWRLHNMDYIQAGKSY